MLISHLHRFIYLKTVKTGGTSVEVYFERFCVDPSLPFREVHARNQEVSRWGVVGCRQRPTSGQTWYNHMPAAQVRRLAGTEVWNSYFKFCVVRNPYDKAVSQFWYRLGETERERLTGAPFDEVRRAFEEFVLQGPLPADREIYTIDGEIAVDQVVRYESLHEGLSQVCEKLKLPWDPTLLGSYKSGFRNRPERFGEYCTPAARRAIEDAHGWEIERFGYAAA